jgi:pimeloyl-ACP methyl ester carboxylesterase
MRIKRIDVGSLDMAYREWSPVGGYSPRLGLPVLCVHGNWSTSAVWTQVAAEVPERCLFAPDLRGRGRTKGPEDHFSVSDLAEDMRGFLDAMHFERAHVLGHSLGAGVAAELALRWPTKVASLTMLAPIWIDGMPPEQDDPDKQRLMHENRGAFAKIYAKMAPKAKRDVFWAGLVETGQEQRMPATMATLEALKQWKPGAELRALAMPRAVIVGEHDNVTGVDTAHKMAATIGIELMRIPDIGHSPHLEAPSTVAEALSELISQAERRRR